MSRKRIQLGRLEKSGIRRPQWKAHWYVYVRDSAGNERRIHRSKMVGYIDETPEAEAQQKLQALIAKEGRQSLAAAALKADADLSGLIYDFAASQVAAQSRGAVSELLVSADLMARGFEVFRAVSHAASCDLIAMRDGETIRVEVKSADQTETGRYSRNLKLRRGAYDVLAVVSSHGRITYGGDFVVKTSEATEHRMHTTLKGVA
jgi:Holliday junction resolvase-like predicted endonuclease